MRMAQLDLNLLNALDVLLTEGSVTAAAERLHLSIPATSRTLDRIRKAMDDPIFVRAGRGLAPTPRALAIQSRLHELVDQARALMELGRDLDLSTLDRTFTLRANDTVIALLAPALLDRTRTAAPGIRLRFMAEGEEDLAPLRDGRIDLDLGMISHSGPEIRTTALYHERLVGVMAADNPLAKRKLTLERLVSVPHVTVSRRGRPSGAFDTALAERGLTRTVAVVVPTFTSAAHIVLNSNLVGLLPERYARQVIGARMFPIGIDLPPITMSQAWHLRQDNDPAHQWLREQVQSVLSADGGRGIPSPQR
jgi:DNA-binding transcriptional LysR family regulator